MVVLSWYEGQEIPQWRFGLTLNALLALLTSLAKMALLVPIVEGLGQLQWLWFCNRSRKLADLEVFDQATRSAFGSLRLLFSLKGGWVIFRGFSLQAPDSLGI